MHDVYFLGFKLGTCKDFDCDVTLFRFIGYVPASEYEGIFPAGDMSIWIDDGDMYIDDGEGYALYHQLAHVWLGIVLKKNATIG